VVDLSVYPVCEWYAILLNTVFFNMEMEWRILILCIETLTFGIIMSWSSQVGSGRSTILLVIVVSGRVILEIWRVRSQKLNL